MKKYAIYHLDKRRCIRTSELKSIESDGAWVSEFYFASGKVNRNDKHKLKIIA
ncbi:hypothetical protein MASR2M36_20280 [Providencia sp.]